MQIGQAFEFFDVIIFLGIGLFYLLPFGIAHLFTFDVQISHGLVEFFVQRLGPTVYNQAIQDARGFLLEKLEDLDVEFYEPDPTD